MSYGRKQQCCIMPVFSCFNGDYSHLKWFSRAFNLRIIRSFLGIYINKYTKTSTNKMSINTKFSPRQKAFKHTCTFRKWYLQKIQLDREKYVTKIYIKMNQLLYFLYSSGSSLAVWLVVVVGGLFVFCFFRCGVICLRNAGHSSSSC